jgi:hypothetical protein
MMFHHRRMQIACALSVFLMITTIIAIRVVNTAAASAATNTSRFKGVNWADARDNFVDGPIIPAGLSTSDNYTATYTKSTAILKGFQTNLGANSIRFGINEKTVSSSWWNSYIAAFDAASALGMNVMIAPWTALGAAGRVTDATAFYNMWDTVINKYGTNSQFYFDIYNEPNGYSDTDWTNFAADFLTHYQNVPREHIVIAGTGNDANLKPVGQDSRLNGTLLSIHLYSVFGMVHTTEQEWIDELTTRLAGYGSRVIMTEFAVPMTTGINYNGPRDGNNDVSFLYAMTDTARNLGMGTIYWNGLGHGDAYSVQALKGSMLTTTNNSAADRLKYGYGL